MKKISSLLSFSLAIILATSFFSVPAFAMEGTDSVQTVSYETLSIKDKEIKVSSELSSEEKLEIVSLFEEIPTLSNEGIITGIEKSMTTFVDVNKEPTKNQGQSKSVISKSELELSMIKSDLSTSTMSKYLIQSVAVWKSSPRVMDKDQFVIGWAGDFALSSYSSKSYWRTSTGQGVAVTSPVSDIVPNAGVAYEYPCGSSDSSFSFDPWYIQIDATIFREKTSGNNPVNVVAKYAHKTTVLGSISVSISPGVISFMASPTASFNTASPADDVIYY